MNSLTLIFRVVALICWFFAMLNLFPNPKLNWWYAGWFFLLLSLVLGGVVLYPAVR